jgi:hypothetical protein
MKETSSVVATSVMIRLKNGHNEQSELGTTNDGVFRVSAEAITAQEIAAIVLWQWVRISIIRHRDVQPVIARPPDGPTDGTIIPSTLTLLSLTFCRCATCLDERSSGRTNFSEVYFSSVTNQLIERTL